MWRVSWVWRASQSSDHPGGATVAGDGPRAIDALGSDCLPIQVHRTTARHSLEAAVADARGLGLDRAAATSTLSDTRDVVLLILVLDKDLLNKSAVARVVFPAPINPLMARKGLPNEASFRSNVGVILGTAGGDALGLLPSVAEGEGASVDIGWFFEAADDVLGLARLSALVFLEANKAQILPILHVPVVRCR